MADGETKASLSLGRIWQCFKVPIILGLISLLCIALSITIFIKSYQSEKPIEFFSPAESSQSEASSSAIQTISVDIEGAVVHPGLYLLPIASRVEDAITAAGGLAKTADAVIIAKTINRAAKVVDGAKIYITKIGDTQAPSVQGANVVDVLVNTTVNINTATQLQLEALSGIGPVTAQKIINNRPYQTLEELVSKKALSQSIFTKLAGQLGL